MGTGIKKKNSILFWVFCTNVNHITYSFGWLLSENLTDSASWDEVKGDSMSE